MKRFTQVVVRRVELTNHDPSVVEKTYHDCTKAQAVNRFNRTKLTNCSPTDIGFGSAYVVAVVD